MAFTAAAPIGFGDTTQGFDALREFYTVMDEKRKEKMKAEAQEFKALQSLAKVRGWAEPDAMTVSDLGSLRGFVHGKIAEEDAQQKQQELAIKEMAAQRERTYAMSDLGKLYNERSQHERGGNTKAVTDYDKAIENLTTGAKSQELAELNHRLTMERAQSRFKMSLANQEAIAAIRHEYALDRDAAKAAIGGPARFVLNDKDKMSMKAELDNLPMTTDPEHIPAAIERINQKYSARAIKPQAAPAQAAPAVDAGKKEAKVPRITELQAPEGSGPKKVATKEEYDALPSGTKYIAPDGSVRTKP